MGEQPPIWRVVANMLYKRSCRAGKGWSSSLKVGRGANKSPYELALSRNGFMSLGPGLILSYDLGSGEGT